MYASWYILKWFLLEQSGDSKSAGGASGIHLDPAVVDGIWAAAETDGQSWHAKIPDPASTCRSAHVQLDGQP